MADHVRDSVFTDPYRVVPWPLSASGCVPSYVGGWCGMSEDQAATLQGVDGEVSHLEGEWLLMEVVLLAKGDIETDAPEGHGLLPPHDLVERCLAGAQATLRDAHLKALV